MPSVVDALSPGDPNSYSRPELCAVVNIHLSLDIDFKKSVLSGHVDLTLQKNVDDVQSVILDTRDLDIHGASFADSGEKLKYILDEPRGTFGSRLQIDFPSSCGKSCAIRVHYNTSPKSSCLQWLNPSQTAGKKHPYLFSQCQAIHARSMLPCQDTPSAKATYSATITAPKELVVLMSAVRGEEKVKDDTRKEFNFVQKVPIPSYLIAIVAGALESRKIGPRSHVWSEKDLVDDAATEFSETEDMLKTAEALMGPYVWGTYDLLVLPPSFPFGGMENPCLTFVTPTVLAGDKSLVSVVAHEISHSWTGNLVTNCNFEHFWLNEGFTMFVERKILGRLHNESFRQFQALEGWKELQYSVETLGPQNQLTQLVVDLKGVNPDDAFSTVPYEKGHTFLFYLERLLGGNEVFEEFLRKYIDTYKYKSVNTDDFKTFLLDYFKDKSKELDSIDWNAWLYSPGMPVVKPEYDSSLAEPCSSLSRKWRQLTSLNSFSSQDIQSLSSPQLIEFLALLLQEGPLPVEKVQRMTDLYGFRTQRNCEIKFRWIRLGLISHWKDAVPFAIKFITEQGRMKYVRPIYRDLYAWEETRETAISTYKANCQEMMHVCAYTLSKDLHLNFDN